jgi:hypothetical protein
VRTATRALVLPLVVAVLATLLVSAPASARVSMTKEKVEQWLRSTCTTFETQSAFKARTARYVNKALDANGNDVTRFSKYNAYTSDSYRLNACLSLIERANSFAGNRRPRTITLQPGTFKLSNAIFVPSYTTIQFSAGTTVNKLMTTGIKGVRASSSMFQTISPSRATRSRVVSAYAGERDIAFRGPATGTATINMMGAQHPAFDKVYGIVVGHTTNVTIERLSFRNNHLGHFLEISAAKDTTVRGNRFTNDTYGMGKATTDTNPNAEAINVDFPDPVTKGVNYTWGAMDRYGVDGLLVEDNEFRWQARAVGTHVISAVRRVATPRAQSDWTLRYHRDVVLRGNRIIESRFDAVKMLNWRDPVLEGNLIDTIRTRTNVSNGKPATAIISQGAENPTIVGNRFVDVPEPMLVRAYDSPHYSFTNRAGRTEKLSSINAYPAEGELQTMLCKGNSVVRPSDATGEIWRTLAVYANTYRSGSPGSQLLSTTTFPSRQSVDGPEDRSACGG